MKLFELPDIQQPFSRRRKIFVHGDWPGEHRKVLVCGGVENDVLAREAYRLD